MDAFSSGLSGATLAVALTATSSALQLGGVPADLRPGRYPFKIDSELLVGTYNGAGTSFSDLDRGLEGTTPAAHRAGVLVHHPIRGDALNQLAVALRQPDPLTFVRPAATRAYLAQHFS